MSPKGNIRYIPRNIPYLISSLLRFWGAIGCCSSFFGLLVACNPHKMENNSSVACSDVILRAYAEIARARNLRRSAEKVLAAAIAQRKHRPALVWPDTGRIVRVRPAVHTEA